MNKELRTKSMKGQEKALNDKKMREDGWTRKKEFWTKKGMYGTWVWAKESRKIRKTNPDTSALGLSSTEMKSEGEKIPWKLIINKKC